MSDDLSIPSPTYRIARRQRGMDPATRRLALIAGCLGGSLLLVVGGWSMIGQHSGAVPVVQADSTPIRVKPANPGGMQVPGANEDILSGDPDTNSGKLAPPPEVPDPQALRVSPPPPAVLAPPPSQPAMTAIPRIAAASADSAPDRSAAAPDRVVAASGKAVTAPEKRDAAASSAPDHVAPVVTNTLVQLAAVSSEAAARIEWQRLQKRMPDLLDRRQPAFSKIEHDGRVLWRVRTGGFSDLAAAAAFCDHVRAKGGGCSVAEF